MARGRDERREWSLRVDRAASEELAILDAHGNLTSDGVDVPEQHDVTRSLADLADRVAGVVHRRAEAALAHAHDEPLHGVALVTREARDLNETADEVDVVSAGHARGRTLHTDGVPDGFELHEGGDVVQALAVHAST